MTTLVSYLFRQLKKLTWIFLSPYRQSFFCLLCAWRLSRTPLAFHRMLVLVSVARFWGWLILKMFIVLGLRTCQLKWQCLLFMIIMILEISAWPFNWRKKKEIVVWKWLVHYVLIIILLILFLCFGGKKQLCSWSICGNKEFKGDGDGDGDVWRIILCDEFRKYFRGPL